jgi:hypothetical protein
VEETPSPPPPPAEVPAERPGRNLSIQVDPPPEAPPVQAVLISMWQRWTPRAAAAPSDISLAQMLPHTPDREQLGLAAAFERLDQLSFIEDAATIELLPDAMSGDVRAHVR